jgi:hypothetical protein
VSRQCLWVRILFNDHISTAWVLISVSCFTVRLEEGHNAGHNAGQVTCSDVNIKPHRGLSFRSITLSDQGPAEASVTAGHQTLLPTLQRSQFLGEPNSKAEFRLRISGRKFLLRIILYFSFLFSLSLSLSFLVFLSVPRS